MTFTVLIVGLGQIGMGYDLNLDPEQYALTHARAFRMHPTFRLVGGVDPANYQRKTFETHYGCPAYAEVKLAMGALQPDVVVVATPTETHYATVREVMLTGQPKVILCEKPLTFEFNEGQEIVDLCTERGCRLFVNYMRRSDCGTAEIKRRLSEGLIGNPEKAVVWYSKGIFNNGSHFLNLLQYWLGGVTGFRIIESGRLWDGVDPEPDVAMSFACRTAYFLAAREENFSHYTIELLASNGRLRYERGGAEILWKKTAKDSAFEGYTILDETQEVIKSDLARAQWHVADQLAESLYGREAQICSGTEALRTLETLVAIRSKL